LKLFHIKKRTNAHIYHEHRNIDTMSLRHVSALQMPSTATKTDTFKLQDRQNELLDVQISK